MKSLCGGESVTAPRQDARHLLSKQLKFKTLTPFFLK